MVLNEGHADVIAVAFEDGHLDLHVHDDESDIEHEPGDVTVQVLLDHGHVDVFDIDYTGSGLDLNVRAYADTGAPGLYDPATVAIEVAREFTVPGSWDICAEGQAWVLPQQQVAGLVWAGWNTDDVQDGDVTGNVVTIHLTGVDNPVGGSDGFCVYTAASGSVSQVYLDSESGPSSFQLAAEQHGHANWTFDHPGTYEVTIEVTANGGAISSGAHTLTFEVS